MPSLYVRSQRKVDSAVLRRLVEHHISSVEFTPEITQELILVFDKVNWIGLYWNNVSREWSISSHTQSGWKNICSLSTQDLDAYIKSNNSFQNIYSVQYRNVNGVDIYTRQQGIVSI